MITKQIGKVLWRLDLFYTILLLDFICFIPSKNVMKMNCLEKWIFSKCGYFIKKWTFIKMWIFSLKKWIFSLSGHFIEKLTFYQNVDNFYITKWIIC